MGEAGTMKRSAVEGQDGPGLVDPVAAAISEMVLDGTYGPGDRLKLSDLAERLGMSVTPIREALWKLEGSGLVQNIPNRGAVVRAIDAAHIRNVYDVRGALDAMLVEKAMETVTSPQLARIEEARLAYEAAVQQGDARTMLAADVAFHESIRGITGNDVAAGVLRSSFQLIVSLRLRLGFDPGRTEEVIREHAEIVEAIRAGDRQAAVQRVRQHANGARASLEQALQDAEQRRGATRAKGREGRGAAPR